MRYLVIKDGDMFALTDINGNMTPQDEKGIYTRDTRFLDTYELYINGSQGVLLNSSCEKNYLSTVFLTNAEQVNDGQLMRSQQIEVKREQLVYSGTFYERTTVYNRSREPMDVELTLKFESTYVDLFEVRGMKRPKRGQLRAPTVSDGEVVLSYEGLDKVTRATTIACRSARETEPGHMKMKELVQPGHPWVVEVQVRTEVDGDTTLASVMNFEVAKQALEQAYQEWWEGTMQVETDSESLNRFLNRGLLDLRTLQTDLGHGPFPVAGIPWFAVPFGRDSLIAALQMITFRPDVAKGTLRTLASLQGTQFDEWRVEEPGKIVHEIRRGEMANLGEIPFVRYYGSVDSTPLFLILAITYYKVTNDTALIEELMPNLLRALNWIDNYSDLDGDGFSEYHAKGSDGLSVQSWKDSYDSMIHVDGQIAHGPMAVSEVQGYVYAAKIGMATILGEFGQKDKAQELNEQAAALKVRFNEAFWMPDREFYAVALDEHKHQVGVVTSDPGHCLWTDTIQLDRVDTVISRLLSSDMFSGWGIRTMSSDEIAYSPISYHNGSVWAHDNSLILLGFARHGKKDAVNQLAEALLGASQAFEYQRLPELFCGHDSDVGTVVRYPVACEPQAWAAGTPLALIQAIMGVDIDAANLTVRLDPTWPSFVSRMTVRNMKVGEHQVSFTVTRETGLEILDSDGVRIEVLSDSQAGTGATP